MSFSFEDILNATHGEYTDHATVTQKLKAVVHTHPHWDALFYVHKESIDMILHKIGRIIAGDPNVADHWDDIAGYSTLSADRCKRP